MATKKKSPVEETRLSRGRVRKEGAAFPVPPPHVGVPTDYFDTLNEIKDRIRSERLRVAMVANAAMVCMYWEIGRIILRRQESEGWGAKVVDRLSTDLQDTFPDMRGLSPRNLKYMRRFAETWTSVEIVQQTVAQLPWGSNLTLLEKLSDPSERLWYANQAMENGWSRNILVHQIESGLFRRQGKAVNNFALTLPPPGSDMAAQIFKDPYLFDFLGTADPRREREVEEKDIPPENTVREPGARYGFENIAIVDAPFDATDGADTPFGKRYGGDVFTLTEQQLQALKQGKTLALDVQNEYITFLTQQP